MVWLHLLEHLVVLALGVGAALASGSSLAGDPWTGGTRWSLYLGLGLLAVAVCVPTAVFALWDPPLGPDSPKLTPPVLSTAARLVAQTAAAVSHVSLPLAVSLVAGLPSAAFATALQLQTLLFVRCVSAHSRATSLTVSLALCCVWTVGVAALFGDRSLAQLSASAVAPAVSVAKTVGEWRMVSDYLWKQAETLVRQEGVVRLTGRAGVRVMGVAGGVGLLLKWWRVKRQVRASAGERGGVRQRYAD